MPAAPHVFGYSMSSAGFFAVGSFLKWPSTSFVCDFGWSLSPLVNRSSMPMALMTSRKSACARSCEPFCGMTSAAGFFARARAAIVLHPVHHVAAVGLLRLRSSRGRRMNSLPSCSNVSKPSTMSRYTPSKPRAIASSTAASMSFCHSALPILHAIVALPLRVLREQPRGRGGGELALAAHSLRQ